MARFTPIRIRENDRTEYARLVKNAKAKIRRTQKNYGINLESEISLPSIEQFSTRDEFNDWKQTTSSFLNRANMNYQFRKNQHGVADSKKNIRLLERKNEVAREKAKKQINDLKNLQTKRAGEKTGEKFGEKVALWADENRTGIHVPAKFDFERFKTKGDYEKRKDKIENRSKPDYYDKRLETMRDNFIRSLEGSFNNNADDLIEEIRSIPLKAFYELYLEHEEFDFELYDSEGNFIYDEDDTGNHINEMMSAINTFKDGKKDTDLWGF